MTNSPPHAIVGSGVRVDRAPATKFDRAVGRARVVALPRFVGSIGDEPAIRGGIDGAARVVAGRPVGTPGAVVAGPRLGREGARNAEGHRRRVVARPGIDARRPVPDARPTADAPAVDGPPPDALDGILVPIAAGSDDAEEDVAAGTMNLISTDLELGEEVAAQFVGMRFADVDIPQGQTLTSAYVQFQVDEVTVAATAVTIRGQAADDAATFTTTVNDISSRAMRPRVSAPPMRLSN